MNRSDRLATAVLIGLCLVTAFLYLPFTNHPFQYDDEHTIVANPALWQPGAWQAAFSGTMPSSGEVLSGHYRPLTYLTYWATLRVTGPWPAAFHAVNLVLHLLATGLLLILVRRLVHDDRVAVLAAGLFALHPAVSETVLYASARATLLSSVFMLAALACFVNARHKQAAGQASAGWWAAWAVLGLGALAAKETSVALPVLCVAVDRVIAGRDTPMSRWARWAPHAAAFSVLLGVAVWLGVWRAATSALSEAHAISQYLDVVLGQTSAIAMAIRLFLLPWPLTVDHPLPAWPGPGALLLVALVGVWCLAGFAGFSSPAPDWRRAGFFALWVVIVALPTTLWPLNVPFQEHRAYLQHAGLAGLTALGVVRLLDTQRAGPAVPALLGIAALIASGWLIIGQGRRWSDPVQLWDHARLIAPASFRAQTNAGLALAAAGRWDEAESALIAALAINPDYPPALVARGVTTHRRGDRASAGADYARAASLKPDYVPALYNLGLLAQESRDPVAAEEWYGRALAINPRHRDSLLNLGVLLLGQGRMNEAAAAFSTARSVSPDAPEVLYYSGVAAERQGRAGDAHAYYRQAWEIALATGRTALARDAQARLTALNPQPSSTNSERTDTR